MTNYESIKSLQEQILKETDSEKKFKLSVELARVAGVSDDKILKSKEDIDAFFMC